MTNLPGATEDKMRHIPLQGQVNFRDLGGYQARDGRSVKWGQVYRSGRLPKLTDSDEMVDEFGSVDGYIRDGLRLSDREILNLRAELLE